jgi:hypothetical protein
MDSGFAAHIVWLSHSGRALVRKQPRFQRLPVRTRGRLPSDNLECQRLLTSLPLERSRRPPPPRLLGLKFERLVLRDERWRRRDFAACHRRISARKSTTARILGSMPRREVKNRCRMPRATPQPGRTRINAPVSSSLAHQNALAYAFHFITRSASVSSCSRTRTIEAEGTAHPHQTTGLST